MVYNKEWRDKKKFIDECKEELVHLWELHESGKITDEEYTIAQLPFYAGMGTLWLHLDEHGVVI